MHLGWHIPKIVVFLFIPYISLDYVNPNDRVEVWYQISKNNKYPFSIHFLYITSCWRNLLHGPANSIREIKLWHGWFMRFVDIWKMNSNGHVLPTVNRQTRYTPIKCKVAGHTIIQRNTFHLSFLVDAFSHIYYL